MDEVLIATLDEALQELHGESHITLSHHIFGETMKMEHSDPRKELFTLAHQVLSLMHLPDSAKEPFSPLMQSSKGRSFALDDLNEDRADELNELSLKTGNLMLKARLSHIVFLISKKNTYRIDAGLRSFDAYLEAAKALDDEFEVNEILTVALRLALSMRKEDCVARAVFSIKNQMETGFASNKLWLSIGLLKVLSDFKSEREYCIASARSHAIGCQIFPNWPESIELWLLYSRLCKRNHDRIGERRGIKKAGWGYWKWSQHSYPKMGKAAEIRNAISTYRLVSGSKKVVAFLQRHLLEAEQESLSEMAPFSIPFEIPAECIDAIKATFTGIPFFKAILRLGMLDAIIDKVELRDQVMKNFKDSPLFAMTGGTMVDSVQGRVISKKPSANLGDSTEKQENVILSRMHEQAQLHIQLTVDSLIQPAIDTILEEFLIKRRYLEFLVLHNPFIPQDRQMAYLRGLHFGLVEDYAVSLHLLIPQLEQSLRYILEQRDVITSKIDDEGIQELPNMAECLANDEMKKILHEDLLFTLRTVFTEKSGSNLRNDYSHGLISDNHFGQPSDIYAWWLILHCVCYPIVASNPGILD